MAERRCDNFTSYVSKDKDGDCDSVGSLIIDEQTHNTSNLIVSRVTNNYMVSPSPLTILQILQEFARTRGCVSQNFLTSRIPLNPSDFNNVPYKELQKVAMQLNLPANMKSDLLKQLLMARYQGNTLMEDKILSSYRARYRRTTSSSDSNTEQYMHHRSNLDTDPQWSPASKAPRRHHTKSRSSEGSVYHGVATSPMSYDDSTDAYEHTISTIASNQFESPSALAVNQQAGVIASTAGAMPHPDQASRNAWLAALSTRSSFTNEATVKRVDMIMKKAYKASSHKFERCKLKYKKRLLEQHVNTQQPQGIHQLPSMQQPQNAQSVERRMGDAGEEVVTGGPLPEFDNPHLRRLHRTQTEPPPLQEMDANAFEKRRAMFINDPGFKNLMPSGAYPSEMQLPPHHFPSTHTQHVQQMCAAPMHYTPPQNVHESSSYQPNPQYLSSMNPVTPQYQQSPILQSTLLQYQQPPISGDASAQYSATLQAPHQFPPLPNQQQHQFPPALSNQQRLQAQQSPNHQPTQASLGHQPPQLPQQSPKRKSPHYLSTPHYPQPPTQAVESPHYQPQNHQYPMSPPSTQVTPCFSLSPQPQHTFQQSPQLPMSQRKEPPMHHYSSPYPHHLPSSGLAPRIPQSPRPILPAPGAQGPSTYSPTTKNLPMSDHARIRQTMIQSSRLSVPGRPTPLADMRNIPANLMSWENYKCSISFSAVADETLLRSNATVTVTSDVSGSVPNNSQDSNQWQSAQTRQSTNAIQGPQSQMLVPSTSSACIDAVSDASNEGNALNEDTTKNSENCTIAMFQQELSDGTSRPQNADLASNTLEDLSSVCFNDNILNPILNPYKGLNLEEPVKLKNVRKARCPRRLPPNFHAVKPRKFKCSNQLPGCTEKFQTEHHMKFHERRCLYRMVRCVNAPCLWKGKLVNMPAHLNAVHTSRIVRGEQKIHLINLAELRFKEQLRFIQCAFGRLFIVEAHYKSQLIHCACQVIPQQYIAPEYSHGRPYGCVELFNPYDNKIHIWKGFVYPYPTPFVIPQGVSDGQPCASMKLPWLYHFHLEQVSIQVKLFLVKPSMTPRLEIAENAPALTNVPQSKSPSAAEQEQDEQQPETVTSPPHAVQEVEVRSSQEFNNENDNPHHDVIVNDTKTSNLNTSEDRTCNNFGPSENNSDGSSAVVIS